mgnify:CR=1 FL=1
MELKAKVTFANGESIVLEDGQLIVLLKMEDVDGTQELKYGYTVMLSYHPDWGLKLPVADFLSTAEFFSPYAAATNVMDATLYRCSAVVKIEDF